MPDEPYQEEIVYNELEYESFVTFFRGQKNVFFILSERKPKLRELKKYNIWQKISYCLPFKTQVNDIIVDAIKVGIGILIGQAFSLLCL